MPGATLSGEPPVATLRAVVGAMAAELSALSPITEPQAAVEGGDPRAFGVDGQMGGEARGGGEACPRSSVRGADASRLQPKGRPAVAKRRHRRLVVAGAWFAGRPEPRPEDGSWAWRRVEVETPIPPTTGRRAARGPDGAACPQTRDAVAADEVARDQHDLAACPTTDVDTRASTIHRVGPAEGCPPAGADHSRRSWRGRRGRWVVGHRRAPFAPLRGCGAPAAPSRVVREQQLRVVRLCQRVRSQQNVMPHRASVLARRESLWTCLLSRKYCRRVCLGDSVWVVAIVLRSLAHGPDVHLRRPFRQAPELKALAHALAKLGHG